MADHDVIKAICDEVARAFHESYERLSHEHGYETREASRKPWEDVPDNNKSLMRAVVQDLLSRGVILVPPACMPEDFVLDAIKAIPDE